MLSQVVSPTPGNCVQSWWALQVASPCRVLSECEAPYWRAVSAIVPLGADDTTARLPPACSVPYVGSLRIIKSVFFFFTFITF